MILKDDYVFFFKKILNGKSMKLKIFVPSMFILLIICIFVHVFEPNILARNISLWSLLAGLFAPVFVGVCKGDIKILVE